MAGSCAAASAADAFDDDELAIPSDLEAALTLLLERAPACAHQLKVATVCQLYAILNDKTDVDRELSTGKSPSVCATVSQSVIIAFGGGIKRLHKRARRCFSAPHTWKPDHPKACAMASASASSSTEASAHALTVVNVTEPLQVPLPLQFFAALLPLSEPC